MLQKKDKDSGVAQEYYTGVVNDDDLTKRLEKAGVEFKQEIPDTTSAVAMNVILTFLPIAFFVGMIIWMTKRMSKGGGMMGIGKSNAKMYVEKQTGVTFKDVAGQDEAKESLQEVVDFSIIRENIRVSVQSFRREHCWSALREQVRRFWRKQ